MTERQNGASLAGRESAWWPELDRTISAAEDDVVALIAALVRIPSENHAPGGDELEAQQFLADWLRDNGLETDVFTPDEVAGLTEHPLYGRDRTSASRPNVVACIRGTGSGRSLMVSGHVDTVQRGPEPWRIAPPFSGRVIGPNLYGRGSYDMKGALAASAYVLKLVRDAGLRLRGDVYFASVVDEECCGGNGTLAALLRGYVSDAVVIPEMTHLEVCHATRGAKVYELTVTGASGHSSGDDDSNPIVGLASLISRLRRVEPHDGAAGDPSGLRDLSASIGSFGMLGTDGRPTVWDFGTVREAHVSMVALAPPGTREDLLDAWVSRRVSACSQGDPVLRKFPPPTVAARSRYVLPSHTDPNHPIVRELTNGYWACTGSEPVTRPATFACDAGIFGAFDVPSVVFGPSGGNAHTADEFVDLDSLLTYMRVLTRTIVRWCG